MFICGVQAALAADAVDATKPAAIASTPAQTWTLQITPYLWAAGLEGDVSPFRRAPTIGVDKSFGDVLDDLNFGGFVNVWGRYERFVFSGDVMYVDTTESHATGPLPPVGPVPPGTVVSGSVDSRQFTATVQGGYRVVDTAGFTLDALAGARIWYVSNDVTVSALGLSRTYGESFGWVDPVIGARRSEPGPVRAEAEIPRRRRVAGQLAHFAPRRGAPEEDRPVAPRGGHESSIGAE